MTSPLLIVTSGLTAGPGGYGSGSGILCNHAEATVEDEDLVVASGLVADPYKIRIGGLS